MAFEISDVSLPLPVPCHPSRLAPAPPVPARIPCLHSWYLSGATATGKTAVGLALARRLDAEIISLDSMAIYRGMDIGTAKPSAAEQAEIRHHLIDIRDPCEDFSVAEYVASAENAIAEIRGRGKLPLFVGGTPLYLKTLLRGLDDVPPADWEFRSQVAAELEHAGSDALYRRVQQVDPLAASQLHPHDTRRLIRVLEVHRATGEPLSHRQFAFEEGRPATECRVFVLRRDRGELHGRIEQRVTSMLAAGLVDEVRQLAAARGGLGRTAGQAVGYCEILEMLAGKCNEAAAVARIRQRTRRFAKRQETWFRSLSECRFLDLTGPTDAETAAAEIFQLGTATA